MDKVIFILLIITFILRLQFISSWLEDWDSVQFALSLHHYSLVSELPHSPGYPLYVLMGKFFYLFFADDNKSLTFLSALLGSLAIVPLYLLVKKMFNQNIALAASLFFVLVPVEWTLSEVALTNIPGQFFLIWLIYLLYILRDNPKSFKFLSIGFGFMLGVRFTEFPIIVSLLLIAILRKVTLKKNLKLLFLNLLFFILGILIWMVPLILITGPDNFIKAYLKIANYIINHDTLLGVSASKITSLKLRMSHLFYLLTLGYTKIFILLSFLGSIIPVLERKFREFRFLFLLTWLLSYFIPLTFFFNLEVTRYTLPLLAPLAILFSFTLNRIFPNKRLFFALVILFSTILLSQSFDQVLRFKNTTPPIIKPVLFVKENFLPSSTVILPTLTLRHFQYYAPEFKVYDLDRDKNIQVDNKIVVIDHLSTQQKIPALANYTAIDKKDYYGDKDIFNRVPSTTIYILKPK